MPDLRVRMPIRIAVAWVAMVMLLGAPLAAQPGTAGSGASFIELCTGQGIERVRVDDGTAGDVPGSACAGERCPWCVLQATPALPATPVSMAPQPTRPILRLHHAFADAPLARHDADPPPSRAPPHLRH